jgi:hypothetical protein
MTKKILAAMAVLLVAAAAAQNTTPDARPRASDLGLKVGILPTGPLDAITDVAGVEVGHTTIIRGGDVRMGVTAILPHPGNLFREKVPGAVFVGNAFGKLAGSTQVNELGEIETPILLTSTLSVPRVADALIDYMLALPGNEDVESINPLVGETNDGYLNDIRGRHITREDVFAAIKNAKSGRVEEGSVGAGTGTVAFGFKGGIMATDQYVHSQRLREWAWRNLLPPPDSQAGRVHGRRPRPDEFWGRAHHRGRSRRPGTRPLLPARRASTGRQRDRSGKRIGDGRHRDRRASGGSEPEADGSEGYAWVGAHGGCGLERQRGLCNRFLNSIPDAHTNGGQGVTPAHRGAAK